MFNKAFALGLVAAVTLGGTCSAATIQPDDVQLTYLGGGAGVFGNGALYVSQTYTFAPGDVVDFGSFLLFPDPWDARNSPPPSTYTLPAYYHIYFLDHGVGGLELIPFQFDVNRVGLSYGSIPVNCTAMNGCAFPILHLITTIPEDKDGVQIAFFGDRPQIVPTPLPAALPMFAAGLGLIWYVRRRTIFKREAEGASRASRASAELR